jgi:hypothetical protein
MFHLNQKIFVVQFFEFFEERGAEGECVGEPFSLVVEPDQSRFQALTQKCASLFLGPVNAFLYSELNC